MELQRSREGAGRSSKRKRGGRQLVPCDGKGCVLNAGHGAEHLCRCKQRPVVLGKPAASPEREREREREKRERERESE